MLATPPTERLRVSLAPHGEVQLPVVPRGRYTCRIRGEDDRSEIQAVKGAVSRERNAGKREDGWENVHRRG